MSPKVLAAREFAIQAHGNQQYGEHPYSYHLDRVAELLAPYGEDAQIAAYLHDTVEDTSKTIDEVQSNFGPLIAEAVGVLTDEAGENRKTRKEKTNRKLAATKNLLALTVKAADRLANLSECEQGSCDKLEMYRGEHEAFWNAAHRAGLCDPLWERIDAIIRGST